MIIPFEPSPFLARSAELDALADAYAHASAVAPLTVLVGGEAGIGKTRLVAEFTAQLATRTPARAYLGGCLALGADTLPYAPFTALLRALAREFGTAWTAGALSTAGRRALAPWLPELDLPDSPDARDKPDAPDQPPAEPDPHGRARLFGAVLTLVEAAAHHHPLVLVVEDLHWADASSRDLLLYLARNLTRPGVLLLATHRSTDLPDDHPLRPLLTALARLGPVRRVDPGPLQQGDVARWLTERHLDPARAGEIHRRSQGNPLFVEALAEAGGPATPVPLRDLLLTALRELPEPGRRVVRAASAAEDSVGHRLLAAVLPEETGLREAGLEEWLRRAVERRLLVPAGDGYRFRHALLRTAVYEDLLPGERARLHTAYARALAADPALAPPGQLAAALATHWHAAGDRPRARSAAWHAAGQARRAHAHAEELALLERVLDLWPGCDASAGVLPAGVLPAEGPYVGGLRVERLPTAGPRAGEQPAGVPAREEVEAAAARAALDAGQAQRGITLATAALARLTDPARRALLLETRSLLKHRAGQDGLDDLREAVRTLPDVPDAPDGPGGAARSLPDAPDAVGVLRDDLPVPPGAPSHPHGPGGAARTLPGAPATGPDTPATPSTPATLAVRARLLATLASRLWVLSHHREAVEHAEAALRLGRAVGEAAVQALALATLAAHASHTGHPERARARCARAAALAAEAGNDDTAALVAVVDSLACKADGRYEDAATAARRGLDAARRAGLAGSRGAVLAAVLADALACLGRHDQARHTAEAALALEPPPLYRAVLLTCLGTVALTEGDTAAATEAAATAAGLITPHYTGREFLLPLYDLQLRTVLEAGDHESAERLLRTALADPGLADHPVLAWPLAHTGLLITEARRPEAVDLTAQLADLIAELAAPGPVQQAQRAACLARLRDDDAAQRAAVAAWRALGHPHPLAEALLRAADAALTAGDRPAAEAYLREAGALAGALGAPALHRHSAQLAARGRLTPVAPEGPQGLGLTPRETEVLHLVAQGRSNRAIGEELFISAKTAGVHVSNILAKLGAASRTEAAALAHRRRLFD
ncbi:AAA family ATPase [Kitasatospora aureofaciens]|uniref:helix-turn-helix transcriptional regulator n=1 Tax=Kitasatospora aureofaciens TaxID=1894 RepID=UPI001C458058|nr:AAA family ATPase [Kitasatospora aureofaciens]MBV6699176.1 AAA family ATPase [Kitasatospora aureofaciens]